MDYITALAIAIPLIMVGGRIIEWLISKIPDVDLF